MCRGLFLFRQTTSQSPRLRETSTTVAITRGKLAKCVSLVIKRTGHVKVCGRFFEKISVGNSDSHRNSFCSLYCSLYRIQSRNCRCCRMSGLCSLLRVSGTHRQHGDLRSHSRSASGSRKQHSFHWKRRYFRKETQSGRNGLRRRTRKAL